MISCAQCKEEAQDLKRCSRCRNISYCSKECQVQHWKTHKRECYPPDGSDGKTASSSPQQQDGKDVIPTVPRGLSSSSNRSHAAAHSGGAVWGIKLLHTGECSGSRQCPPIYDRFITEHFAPTHPIFTHGELCPLTSLYGIPLVIFSPELLLPGNKNRPTGDNQAAVYLRIEPSDGFAPFHWQIDYPGDCFAVRGDRKPLSKELLEAMYEYHSSLLSSVYFEEILEGKHAPGYNINPKAFQKFSDNFWGQEKRRGRTSILESDGRL